MRNTRWNILLFFLLLTSSLSAQESSFVLDFSERWQNVRQYTLEVAEMMPAKGYDYQPSEEEMSFGAQVKHLSSNIVYLSFAYLSPSDSIQAKAILTKTREANNKEDILTNLQISFDFMDDLLKNYDSANLDSEVDFFAGKMSQRRIFFLITDHLAHHRGQLIVYLRLNNLKPPRYTGW